MIGWLLDHLAGALPSSPLHFLHSPLPLLPFSLSPLPPMPTHGHPWCINNKTSLVSIYIFYFSTLKVTQDSLVSKILFVHIYILQIYVHGGGLLLGEDEADDVVVRVVDWGSHLRAEL